VELTPFERSRVIRVGNVDANVAESGSPGATPIVFLHGNPDCSDVWCEVARRLAPTARCIAPDLPNWGASIAHEPFDCSLDNQAAYVKGVIDGLELDKVHLVVHDVGGPFGLSFATLYPERLRTLTMFNTSYSRTYKWHRLGRYWRTPILGELIMLVGFVNGIIDAAPRMPRAYAERAWDAFRWRTRRMVLRFYRAMDYAKVLPGWDERFLAATASIPRQVIWGLQDPYVSPDFADKLGAPVVHRLPDASHWAMIEDPDSSARLIGSLVHADKPAAAGA
jgi:pimeloyl-ACP methyl ester carboxylesterase